MTKSYMWCDLEYILASLKGSVIKFSIFVEMFYARKMSALIHFNLLGWLKDASIHVIN